MKDVTIAFIAAAVNRWRQHQPVSLCVLFGSRAGGTAHPHSDVDLAVWPTQAVLPMQRLDWLSELEIALGQAVSLVLVTPDLDPVLQFEIVRQGRLLFEARPGLWDEQRLHMWHAYNDSLLFRRAARRQLHEFAAGVRHAAGCFVA